jgi:hypothetical protein
MKRTTLLRKLLRLPASYSVSWDGPQEFGALQNCSRLMAHRIGRDKADGGCNVIVTHWEGMKARIEWTNA